ncbi:unnamed protein product [Gadus morhua 'NCC']
MAAENVSDEYKWTDVDTAALISWRSTNEGMFTGRRNAAQKGFEEFIKVQGLEGKMEANKIKRKWENLKQKYKELKAPRTGVSTEGGETTAASWKWEGGGSLLLMEGLAPHNATALPEQSSSCQILLVCWSPPPGLLLLVCSFCSPPPGLLLVYSSWSPPPGLLLVSSWSPPPGLLLVSSSSPPPGLLLVMVSPRRYLETSTALPLALSWGLNVGLYLGLLLLLLLLLGLLLWLLLRQLKHSVGFPGRGGARSLPEPCFGLRCSYC